MRTCVDAGAWCANGLVAKPIPMPATSTIPEIPRTHAFLRRTNLSAITRPPSLPQKGHERQVRTTRASSHNLVPPENIDLNPWTRAPLLERRACRDYVEA